MEPFRRAASALALAALPLSAHAVSGDVSEACPEVFSPVCSYAGSTFVNSCLAESAGQSVAYPGACIPPAEAGTAEKVNRAADLFLARAFFSAKTLEAKLANYAAVLARLDAVAASPRLSSASRQALRMIRARYVLRGERILASNFQLAAERQFRSGLAAALPFPVSGTASPSAFAWGVFRTAGGRLSSPVDVAWSDGSGERRTSFEVSFSAGTFRTVPYVPQGSEVVLRPGAFARVRGSDVVFRVDGFVDSPCPDGAACFWSGRSVETSWYRSGRAVRLSGGGEAFGYRMDLLDTDWKTYARVRISETSWGR